MKKLLNFDSLSEIEKSLLLNDTWCNKCGQADLGITHPELYVENGSNYISGKCSTCGTKCISEIIESNINE